MKLKTAFDFYSVVVNLSCLNEQHAQLLEWLEEDFSYFIAKEEPTPTINISIVPALKEKALFPFIKTKMCLSYGWWKERICFYDSATVLYQNFSKQTREMQIMGSDTEYIYEIIYTYILSAVGEALEKKGMMRFHALGIEKNNKAKFYLLPSKGGKSTLAYEILNETDLQIYSDEIVLFDGEKVFPFPVRIALADPPTKSKRMFKRKVYEDKWIFPIPNERVAKPHVLGTAYASSHIYFLWAGFWGLGLPQMSEFFLRVPMLFELLKMSYRRKMILLKILFSKKFKRIKKQKLLLKDIS